MSRMQLAGDGVRQNIYGITVALLAFVWTIAPVLADSSSPLLAAYYDRQMAILDGAVHGWRGTDKPRRFPFSAVQVGVGRDSYFCLTKTGDLIRFQDEPLRQRVMMSGVVRFAAGDSGVLAIKRDGTLWWLAEGAGARRRIADNVAAAAVGDGANYYIKTTGALFVKGKAHRGQYGDGRLEATDRFVRTAVSVAQITAHTGHAILLKTNGDVMGTGGNIYGPVGRHGLGDKAVRWSKILSGVKAIATGSSHSVALRQDGALMAWGSEYGTEPVQVMGEVTAVAAGSYTTVALRRDGTLWQWNRGEKPRHIAGVSVR